MFKTWCDLKGYESNKRDQPHVSIASQANSNNNRDLFSFHDFITHNYLTTESFLWIEKILFWKSMPIPITITGTILLKTKTTIIIKKSQNNSSNNFHLDWSLLTHGEEIHSQWQYSGKIWWRIYILSSYGRMSGSLALCFVGIKNKVELQLNWMPYESLITNR